MTIRPPDDGEEVIFRPWFRHPRTGKKIYAAQFGKRAFRIVIKKDSDPDPDPDNPE